jgi:hypothetical protein
MKITLKNDFHNTQVTLDMKSSVPTGYQVKKSQKTLCPVAGCICGDVMGMRGPQDIKIVGQEYLDGKLVPRFAI